MNRLSGSWHGAFAQAAGARGSGARGGGSSGRSAAKTVGSARRRLGLTCIDEGHSQVDPFWAGCYIVDVVGQRGINLDKFIALEGRVLPPGHLACVCIGGSSIASCPALSSCGPQQPY
jgi:hypothetical protein